VKNSISANITKMPVKCEILSMMTSSKVISSLCDRVATVLEENVGKDCRHWCILSITAGLRHTVIAEPLALHILTAINLSHSHWSNSLFEMHYLWHVDEFTISPIHSFFPYLNSK